jgi:hypothetical protein
MQPVARIYTDYGIPFALIVQCTRFITLSNAAHFSKSYFEALFLHSKSNVPNIAAV